MTKETQEFKTILFWVSHWCFNLGQCCYYFNLHHNHFSNSHQLVFVPKYNKVLDLQDMLFGGAGTYYSKPYVWTGRRI